MRTFVAAALSLAPSTALAAGRLPRTSPPLEAARFDSADLSGSALVYICLHGLAEQRHLYGDQLRTAIRGEQIRGAKLDGAIVYLAVCWGSSGM